MSQASDLAEDALLETDFRDEYTVHIYNEAGPIASAQVIKREEHWRQQKHIGFGSYGKVWLQQCVKGSRGLEWRAVKEIHKFPQASKQIDYHRELKAISAFSQPEYEQHFVKSFGWYESYDAIYIAMEYCEQGDLQKYLNSAPPLPEAEAQRITCQILEGLHFMHGKGYSHRDLKPGNILVKRKPPGLWWVKLSDFGISKRAADNLGASTVKGTLEYMAPELLRFAGSDEESDSPNPQAADMWALGEIAHRMLTKQATFKSFTDLFAYFQPPHKFPSGLLRAHAVSEIGVDFINNVMRPEPKKRQTTGQALLGAWMELSIVQTIGRESSVFPEPTMPVAAPASSLGESLPSPSGKWTTVSAILMPTPHSRPSANSSGAPESGPSTMETTITYLETNASTLDLMPEDTTTRLHPLDSARYFALKSGNEINIRTSIARGIWSCGGTKNSMLSNAYKSTSGPIFLIFSVNGSGKFLGVAQMKSPWSPSVTTEYWEGGTWDGGFLVEWLSQTPVQFDDVRHLTFKEIDSKSITTTRWPTEIWPGAGREMMRRFGVSHLVPLPTQPTEQPNDMSLVGSLGVGGLGLTTATQTSRSNTLDSISHANGNSSLESTPDLDDAGQQTDAGPVYPRLSTSKRLLEIEDSEPEDEKRRRI